MEANRLEQELLALNEQVLSSYQAESGKLQITDIYLEIDELESETVRLSSLEFTTLKKAEASFNKFIREVDAYRQSFEQREFSRLKRERGFLEDEAEQLKISREHIEVNVKHVEDEKESTERGIERQTKDYQLEQDRLSTLNKNLIADIEELRRQLEIKVAEQERVAAELATVDEKIESIRSKFKKQLDRVAKKQEKALEERNANEQELLAIKRKINEISDQEEKIKQTVEKYVDQQSQASLLKDQVGREMLQLENRNRIRDKLIAGMNTSREAYQEEAYKLKQLEESLATTETILKKIDIDIEASLDSIQKMEDKIPTLEKDKKTAAASRNFLEANKLSKEIKEKKDDIQKEQEKVAKLRIEREEVHNREPEKMKEAEKMRKVLSELRKVYDIWIYKIECLRIEELERIKQLETDVTPDDLEAEYQYSLQKKEELYKQYSEAIDQAANIDENSNIERQIGDENDQSAKQEAGEVADYIERERKDTGYGDEIVPEDQTEVKDESTPHTEDHNKESTEEERAILTQQIRDFELQVEDLEKAYQKTENEINEASEVGDIQSE